jgi:cysteine desulfurase
MRAVYLDNNATTRVAPEVVAAMLPCLTEDFGNPSSVHDFGATSRLALKEARERVRALLGAAFREEILFTSGGTEADNTAILGALEATDERNEIVVSAVEHPAVLALCSHLERTRHVKVHRIPVDALGGLDRARYRAALSRRVALASIMWANNETGVVFPVEELAEEAKAVGALFHTDAVQAVGRLPIALRGTAIDMLSLSAHKLHGPKGVGALYVRRGAPFRSLMLGGNQERGRRGGTENTPGIVGLGKAAEMATSRLRGDAARMRALRDRLEASLLGQIQGGRDRAAAQPRRGRRLFRGRLLRRLASSLARRARDVRPRRRRRWRDALFAVARQRRRRHRPGDRDAAFDRRAVASPFARAGNRCRLAFRRAGLCLSARRRDESRSTTQPCAMANRRPASPSPSPRRSPSPKRSLRRAFLNSKPAPRRWATKRSRRFAPYPGSNSASGFWRGAA